MSNFGRHHDDNNSNDIWGNTAGWTWPSDQLDQIESSPPRPPPRRPVPHYHRQLPPLSHTNPIASLTAALRGENPALPRPNNYTAPSTSRQPTPPRQHQPNRDDGFGGYLPDHLFYSPPESREQTPQDKEPSGSNHNQPFESNHNQPFESNHNQPFESNHNQPPYAAASSTAGPSASHQTIDSSADNSPATMPRASTKGVRKRSHGTAIDLGDAPQAKRPRKPSLVEHIDLASEEDAEEEMLEKERQELVKKQREESGRAVRLNDQTCMICLEHFTNLTVTHCGHIFCHECLAQALNASQRTSERNIGTCPACRKPVKRGASIKNQIIPLALMKRPKPSKKIKRPRNGSTVVL